MFFWPKNTKMFIIRVKCITVIFVITRKYPLRGYILGVLTHTTAWDRLWGGDVFLRLHIRSSASPRLAAVGLGCWNCSKGGYLNWHQDLWPWWNLEVWRDAGCRMPISFALPSRAVASVWFWMYFCHHWNTSDNFVQWNFLFWWLFFVTGRDVTDWQTDKRT